MPLKGRHACVLREKSEFEEGSFRTMKREHDGREYDVIIGRPKGSQATDEHSYHYPTDSWTESQAKSHCKDHDGIRFEPAASGGGSSEASACVDCGKKGEAVTTHQHFHVAAGGYDLTALHESVWLADPACLRQTLARVIAVRPCPTAREIAAYRRERLEEAKAAPSRAVESSGTDLPGELRLADGRSKPIRAVKGKVGVISVSGMIQQKMTGALMKSGGTSTEEVGVALDALVEDPKVGAVVLRIDSGGGGSHGVEELSDKIYAARGKKQIYASVDPFCASAAYWVGSSAETVACTPSGDCGSIGVFVLHADESKALEAGGIKVSIIRAGRRKLEFNPVEPLTAEVRASVQKAVDNTYTRFTESLKRNRDVGIEHVRTRFGEGGMLNPEEALEAKMVDRILSFEHLLHRLTGAHAGTSAGRAASAEILRLRHEQKKRQAKLLAEGR